MLVRRPEELRRRLNALQPALASCSAAAAPEDAAEAWRSVSECVWVRLHVRHVGETLRVSGGGERARGRRARRRAARAARRRSARAQECGWAGARRAGGWAGARAHGACGRGARECMERALGARARRAAGGRKHGLGIVPPGRPRALTLCALRVNATSVAVCRFGPPLTWSLPSGV